MKFIRLLDSLPLLTLWFDGWIPVPKIKAVVVEIITIYVPSINLIAPTKSRGMGPTPK